MTDPSTPTPPPPDPPSAEPELVDTTPAAPDRTAITYGILFVVLAALLAYFLYHFLRSH
jgi:hypothetical protein